MFFRFNADFLAAVMKKTFKIHKISTFTSRTYKFDLKNKQTGKVEPNTSVFDYFKRQYNIHLEHPDLPVIETTKKGVVYPMEVCHMMGGQRYPYKLDEAMV